MAISGPGSTPAVTDLTHGDGDDAASHHPNDREYIRIAIILTLITAVEVAIYYIEGVRDFLIPALIIMSVAKFVMVVGFFMHLKFDDRRFTILFIAGLGLSIAVVSALVLMFWTGSYVPDAPSAINPAAH